MFNMNLNGIKRTVATSTRRELHEPEDAKDALSDEFLELPEEDDKSAEAKKMQGKKRKVAPKASQTARSAPKKLRGMRGKLKDLIEMPIDVLFEIFSQMNPLDLVHLARTSKDLRAMLMNRSSASIWRSVRSDFHPQIPDCPEDLTEPAYAELLFGKSCHYCQRNVTIYYGWYARKRICNKCLRDCCDGSKWYKSSTYDFYGIQVPYLIIEKRNKDGGQDKHYHFFIEIEHAWIREYRKLDTTEDKQKWIQALSEDRDKIEEHAHLCTVWFTEYQKFRETEIAAQQALVALHVEALGWADEVSEMPSSVPKFQDLTEIVKLCKKEFTEKTLTTLEVKINTYMEEVKQERLDKMKLASLRTCRKIYEQAYFEHMATISDAYAMPYPTASELLLEPTILNILTSLDFSVKKEHTLEDLAPIISAIFPDATERLRQRVNGQLIAYVRDIFPNIQDTDTTEESGIFNLATTVFACRLLYSPSCVRRCFWYEDIAAHTCGGARSHIPTFERYHDNEQVTLNDVLSRIKGSVSRYSIMDKVTGDVVSAEVVSKLITLCGLDPLKTTKQMMDEVDPIFECIGCNNPERGRATMTWSAMVPHYKRCHTDVEVESFNTMLLTGEEAATVRKRITEQQARARAANNPCIVACRYCDVFQDSRRYYQLKRQDIVAHIKSLHGKAKVTDNDLPLLRDYDKVDLSIFYMWPPRPESDEEA